MVAKPFDYEATTLGAAGAAVGAVAAGLIGFEIGSLGPMWQLPENWAPASMLI